LIAVTILGSNSALPAYGRHQTSQIVQTRDEYFLVDCGESVQEQMNHFKIRKSRINHIFISHLHGDHYFGLIGLLNTYALNKRLTELNVYSPPGLEEVVRLQMKLANGTFTYPIHFHEIHEGGILLEDEKIKVTAFETKHRIACFGFLFTEKKVPYRLNIEQVKKYNIPKEFYSHLHYGEDYITESGQKISNHLLTTKTNPPKSYAYCADTVYFEEICACIQGADLIYHESTYLQDLEDRAHARYHSTTIDAANIARKANVKRLLLGHFSSMYENLEPFKKEAQTIFENTDLAIEGATFIA